MAIEAGETAPAFTLNDQDGNRVALKNFRGRTVVIFFYPKDNTPGCTKEACGFRDNIRKFDALDTVILGVSPDAADSHVRFIDKFRLPFTLLSDPDRKVMEQYGAWGEKVLYGVKRVGVIRSTTIVGPDGKVLKHWKRVPKAADHPNKVLEFLESQST
ncbi:MAG: thioredoxin-dependent thiol peroxidase [Gammaproteobacteria bacterium]|nr:thioredoxin-dependent thiol peroxidase [Gammaproteobacteria bacterium]MXY66658.1 thioredoxin-dependent thiol peroxidase [Gammaproteobacteria bacterium]MYG67604.1 thioredoxin-dependent thiol peroxidase [Gammaproteobacteria bacterium]